MSTSWRNPKPGSWSKDRSFENKRPSSTRRAISSSSSTSFVLPDVHDADRSIASDVAPDRCGDLHPPVELLRHGYQRRDVDRVEDAVRDRDDLQRRQRWIRSCRVERRHLRMPAERAVRVSSAMRSMRYCTRSKRVVPFANTRNATSVAITRSATPVRRQHRREDASLPLADRIAISVTIENTNVATKTPRQILVRRERMNTRTARGEYWLAASWIATRVVANTIPRNASIPVATTEVSVNAVSASPTSSR